VWAWALAVGLCSTAAAKSSTLAGRLPAISTQKNTVNHRPPLLPISANTKQHQAAAAAAPKLHSSAHPARAALIRKRYLTAEQQASKQVAKQTSANW